MGRSYISLDIGGTKVLGAIFDENNNIVYRIKKKTKAEEGFLKIEERIIKLVNELISESGMDKNSLTAIGAGAPGIIDEDKGEIIFTPNLPWRNYNIRSVIEDRFKVPFYIGNDVKLGVFGEWRYGAGVGRKNVVGIFVGTGVGGGIIIDNKLYTGARHSAGEVGHMVINTEGPYCNCGQRGCLEAYSSKIAMAREIKSQIAMGRKTILKDLMEDNVMNIRSKALKKALEEKDELAIEVIDRAVYYLAAGAGSLVNLFNPDMLILGGGVMEAIGDYVLQGVKERIKRFAMPDILNGTSILKSALEDDAIVYGALALMIDKTGKK